MDNTFRCRSSAEDRSMTTPALSTSSTVLRCESITDLLAAFPFLTGFTADNSLFVLAFSAARASRSMRIQLPSDERPAALTRFLDGLCAMLRDTGAGPGGPALIITSTQSFADAGGPPWRALAARIQRRFAREGWQARAFACIAPDGWTDYLEGAVRPSPRPLAEIHRSPVIAEAKRVAPPPASYEQFGQLPSVAPEFLSAVRAELDRPAHSTAADTSSDDRLREAVTAIGNCIRDGESAMTAADCARLIQTSTSDEYSLLIPLAILTRTEFVHDVLAQSRNLLVGIPIESPPGRPPGTSASVRGILESLGAAEPPVPRLRRGGEVLGAAAVCAPEEYRAPLLSLVAWSWWMQGMQSVASRHSTAALESQPMTGFSVMVDRLLELHPAWLWGRETASSRERRQSGRAAA